MNPEQFWPLYLSVMDPGNQWEHPFLHLNIFNPMRVGGGGRNGGGHFLRSIIFKVALFSIYLDMVASLKNIWDNELHSDKFRVFIYPIFYSKAANNFLIVSD